MVPPSVVSMPALRVRTRSGLNPSIGTTANSRRLATVSNPNLRANLPRIWKSLPSTNTTLRVLASCVRIWIEVRAQDRKHLLQLRRISNPTCSGSLLVNQDKVVCLCLDDDLGGVSRDQDIRTHVSQKMERPPLKIGMQIYFRLIYQEYRGVVRLDDMSEHLTPDLEAEPSPKQLARDSFLGTKHIESRFVVRIIDSWRLYVHSRPCLCQGGSKLRRSVRIVIPNIPGISSGAVVEQSQTRSFLFE
jgi:hypothetical protein